MRIAFVSLLALAQPFLARAAIDLDSFTGPAPTAFAGFQPTTSMNPASTNYTAGSSSRLAFYVPAAAWPTYQGWLTFYKSLVMIGIPVKVTTNYTEAITHPVVLAYQAFTGTVAAAESTAWKNYVNGGKTLITTSLTTSDTTMRTLFGVVPDTTTNVTQRSVIALQKVTTTPGSNYMSQINFTDTRDSQIPMWGSYVNKSFPNLSYKNNAKTVVALGYYLHQGTNVQEKNMAISMNIVGTGQAIAFGLDIGAYIGVSQGNNTWGIPRDYAATYEPGYDTFLRLIKSMYISNAGYMTFWPVPSNMGIHFVWSYDIDASDSWQGAVNITKALSAFGIPGTINWQTKLVTDAYDVNFFTQFYQNISLVESYGNMELASHSVSHSINLANFSVGTGLEIYNTSKYREGAAYWPFIGQCLNTTGPWLTNVPNSTYCDTPTNYYWFYTIQDSLIAEVRISKFLLETVSTKGSIVRSYRTGHLIFPLPMPDIWAQYGIKYTSSGASNDQNTHLPFQLFSNRNYYREVDVIEFSMTTSDEDLSVENGDPINNVWAVPGTTGYPQGSALFQQQLLLQKLSKYGGSYTFLLHPTTFGLNVPWATTVQLFADKYAFQQAFIPLIRNISYFDTMAGRGDFHYARLKTGLDWVLKGTTVTATVMAPLPINNLTIHFPTTWSLLTATTAISLPAPGAVVLVGSIAAGNYTLTFTTATTTQKPSFPSAVPSATFPVNTQAAPTTSALPDPTRVVVDAFSNPQAYNLQNNSLGEYTYDDKTTVDRTSVQGDFLLIDFNTTSYWYTLLGPANTCNDYSKFDTLQLAFRFPKGIPVPFSINLQDVDTATCQTATSHYVPIGPGSNYTLLSPYWDWQRVNIPFTAFGVTTTALKAVTLARFNATGSVEVDYVFIGSGNLTS